MLSKEEKEAIEILKTNPKTILDLISLDEKLLDKLSETENYSVEEIKEWAYKIILNLIEKLQEENEVLKRTYDKQTGEIGDYLLELQKKDKIIDLMAEELKKHIFILSDGSTITSKKGIIKHYERKATNDD